MSVDSIRYCLERATDDRAFESLCCDVLSCDGYDSIEPIGGTGDGGRDALHKTPDAAGVCTIFAYSLRKDWKVKLQQDCERIRDVGHACHRIVFAFIKQPTPTERDAAIARVKSEFGWELDLYGLERLRTQLAGRANHLLSAYPAIFSPRFFENVGGELIGKEQRDLILIDHVEFDFAFACWLARRLEIAGYHVCCNGLAPFGGLNLDESVRKLMNRRAAKYIAILSPSGAADGDLRGRCEAAASIPNCFLPIVPDAIQVESLSKRIRETIPISFADGWASGLSSLLQLLRKHDVPLSWDVQSGRATALSSIIPEPLTKDEPEELYSNAFPVVSLPESILTVPLRKPPNPAQLQALREEWAFVLVGQTAFSFQHPPSHELIINSRRYAESSHLHTRDYNGRRPGDVVSELVRRCMELACYRAGLKWCPDRELIYFSNDGQDSRMIGYRDVTGEKRRTGVTGKKSLFRPGPEPNEIYRYALSPKFAASGRGLLDSWEVRMRLFLRMTDDSGAPHSGRAVTTRRKAAAKGWFNQHWFAKTLAAIQHVGGDQDLIMIGAGDRSVQVSTKPKSWICPVSIDSAAIARMMAEQKQTRESLVDSNEETEPSDE